MFSLDDWPQLNEQVLPTKLVYKAKQTSKGNLDKLKGSVVAHSDLEKGPYKMDTWAPCATARGIKILLAFAAKNNKRVNSGDFVWSLLAGKASRESICVARQELHGVLPKVQELFWETTTAQERDLWAHD
jgi:hypothetical protein